MKCGGLVPSLHRFWFAVGRWHRYFRLDGVDDADDVDGDEDDVDGDDDADDDK